MLNSFFDFIPQNNILKFVFTKNFSNQIDERFEEIDSFMLDWATENGVRAAFVRPDRYVYGGVSSMSDFAITYAALAQHLGA